jgi:hypothetical protein
MSGTGLRTRALLTVAFIAAVSLAGMRQLRPPSALPVSAPADEFSGARALVHLRAFARQPHPFGSPAQNAVRQYIVDQLTALGVPARVEALPVSRDARGGYPLAAGIVRDVIATVPGSENTRPLVMLGHYDSVPGGPGAADDGEGVAVLLEALRALRSGTPLRNDVIFLFTDGEEAGLLGAKAFVDAHASLAGLALNFESRGSSGPAMMFETSKGNGWLVRHLAQAAPYPVANSLSYEVYQLLPNDTDLTVFKQAGIPGMDFAFIGDVTNYHTRIDDVAHIDPRSLQHQGSYALSLARHFGNLDLRQLTAPDVTYFNFPGLGVAIYPVTWSAPLALIAAVFFVAVVWLGWKRRPITAGGLLSGVGILLLAVLADAGAVMGLWKLVLAWHPGFLQMLQGDPYDAWIYRIACTALAVAIFTALYQLIRRRIGMASLWAGALLVWLALCVATALSLAGAAYIFTWPLLFSIGGLAFLAVRRAGMESWGATAILWACAVPAIVMIGPTIDQLFVAMTMAAAPAPALFTALLLGLLLPLVEMVAAPRRWWLPAAAATVCAVCLIAGASAARFDSDHPKPTSLFYGLDADNGTATWFSGDARPEAWVTPVLGPHPRQVSTTQFMPFLKWPMFWNTGAVARLASPVLERLDESTAGDVRTLRLRVASARGANDVFVYGDPHAQVLGAEVNGKSVGPDIRVHDNKPGLSILDAIRFNQWSFEYFGPPPEGVELRLRVKATAAPLRLVVVDQSYGLDGSGAPRRPADTMPFPWVTDSVFVRKTYSF